MSRIRRGQFGRAVGTAILLLCVAVFPCYAQGQDEIFSGPQPGETIAPFDMKLGTGERAGQEVNLVEQAGELPLVLVFVHKRSRPAFGLANAIMKYCQAEGGDGLAYAICFLTADPTDTQNWLGRVQQYFPKGVAVGYSPDGVEGPGALGLNREVTLTVLIGKQKKVVSNFALVQPGAHADGPKILQAIAAVTGNEKKPDINAYLPNNQAVQDAPIAIDPRLQKEIRILNGKDSDNGQRDKAIAAIDELVKDSKPLQNQLAGFATRWVRSGRVNNIGNETHQAAIKKWAQDYGRRAMNSRDRARTPNRNAPPPELANRLRQLIQKTNSADDVAAAAKSIEDYLAENPSAVAHIARISNTIVNSGKLENYGTSDAQQVLKNWAEKYKPQSDRMDRRPDRRGDDGNPAP